MPEIKDRHMSQLDEPKSQLPFARIERLPDVIARTGMGKSWIYAAVQRGQFPKPVKLSARAIGWRSSDVDLWLASRAA